jgi:hypothetical protein
MSNPQTLLDGAFARRLERLTLVSRKIWLADTSGGVNCETGWACVAWPVFSLRAQGHEKGGFRIPTIIIVLVAVALSCSCWRLRPSKACRNTRGA